MNADGRHTRRHHPFPDELPVQPVQARLAVWRLPDQAGAAAPHGPGEEGARQEGQPQSK